MPIRTLLIDNYDSYTYNLFQLIAEVNGELPTVLRNNDVDLPTLLRRIEAKEFDNIVISPGPGTPERAADVGVSLQLLQAKLPVPTLGVCLGFQALALAHGGSVCHAPEPVHGRLSSVDHSGHPLFAGIPSGPAYAVVRYHSLLVEEASLPPCLQAIAWTCGQHHALQLEAVSAGPTGGSVVHGEPAASASPQQQHQHQEQQQQQQQQQQGTRLLMAIAHRSLPHWGVQFHPESVATAYGVALLRNFAAMTHVYHGLPLPATPPSLLARLAGPPGSPLPPLPWDRQPGSLRLHHSKLPGLLAACGGSEALFWHLFGGGNRSSTPGSMDSTAAADTFWLDSVTTDRARFSFMGGRGGGLWRRIEYRLASPQTTHPEPAAAAGAAAAAEVGGAEAGSDNAAAAAAENTVRQPSSNNSASSGSIRPGTLTLTAADGQREVLSTDFFGWLEGLLASHRCQVSPEDAAALPFNFWGGLVGYLGYELKAECGGRAAHLSPTPDAAFFMADRLLAVDHFEGDVYLVALSAPDSKQSQAEAQQWVEQLAEQVHGLAASPPAPKGQLTRRPLLPQQQVTQHPHQQQHPQQQQQKWQANGTCSNGLKVCCDSAAKAAANGAAERALQAPFRAREGRRRYLQNISSCLEALYNGDSYEVCLTTRLSRRGAPDAARLYRTLRRINPAPYAAWLRFGPGALQLCCCSPERFLRGDRGGQLEAKPIKGTAPRSADPQQDQRSAAELAASEKDRAENLMIVDLLRNDLGRVCTPGSVHVPHLMCIESYATVHQMVSTVRGQRRPGATIVDCLRAAFPGGSMTGAPKIRTMEIIDGLEQGPRGVYSGSLGYISFNDTFDLNIVIRTAAITPAPGEEAAGASEISIGAGGAIVVQSDPEGEVEEMRLKARALLRAIGECDGGSGPAAVEDDDL